MFTAMAPMLPILIENFAVRFRKKKNQRICFPLFLLRFGVGSFCVKRPCEKKIIAANYNETKLS
jgi:hypothetical protein